MFQKLKSLLFSNINTRQTVAKNTFWLFLGEAVSRVLKMILVIYAARILGSDGWGTFSYALSLSSLLMLFSDIGLSNLVTREALQRKENYKEFVSTAIFTRNILLFLSALVSLFLSPLISNIPQANILFPFTIAILLFDSLRDLGFAINRVFEKMEREMIVKTVMSIVIVVLGASLLYVYKSPRAMAFAYAVGSATGFCIIGLYIRKDIRQISSAFNIKTVPDVIRTALPFAIITLVGSVMVNADIYMLGIWSNSTEIGLYASAQRMQQFILIIPSMIATAVFPFLSRNVDQKEQFASALNKTTVIGMMLGIPIAVGGVLLSTPLITLIFGNQFIAAVPIMKLLMLMLFVSFPLVLLSSAVIACNEQITLVKSYTYGLIINVLLNLLLIPQFGAIGATIATFISTFLITTIVWLQMKRLYSFKLWAYLKKILIATSLMSLCILFIEHFQSSVLLTIALAGFAYCITLIALKERHLMDLKTFI